MWKKREWGMGREGLQRSEFGHDPAICLSEEAIFVKPQKRLYHMTFHLDLDLEHILDADQPWTILRKFGGDPAICLRRSDLRKYLLTDGRTRRTDDARRTTAYSSFHLGLS